MLGTKISIEIIRIIIYFSIEIEKYSRNPQKAQIITKVSISLEKSRSRLKSKVLANLIETKSRNLDRDYPSRQDLLLKTVEIFLTVKTDTFWASRSRSRSRSRRDQSRPPTLVFLLHYKISEFSSINFIIYFNIYILINFSISM